MDEIHFSGIVSRRKLHDVLDSSMTYPAPGWDPLWGEVEQPVAVNMIPCKCGFTQRKGNDDGSTVSTIYRLSHIHRPSTSS